MGKGPFKSSSSYIIIKQAVALSKQNIKGAWAFFKPYQKHNKVIW